MKQFLVGICILVLGAQYSQAVESTVPSKKNQLEELFIWKVSDELKLSTGDEKKFADVLKRLNLKKQTLNQNLEELSIALLNSKTDLERKNRFKAYRKILLDLHMIPVEELDQMHAILGTQKLAKYLEVKNQLTNKVKSLLLNPDKVVKERKPLPAPQVIEE